MLNNISSKAEDSNPYFEKKGRYRGENNTSWLLRHLKTLASEDGAKGCAYLVLLGGKKQEDFRLRVAQSQIRHDMSPSHWSHVVLLQGAGPTEKGAIWEVSLEPTEGFGYPPSDNGVQTAKLANYASKNQYPNVAVMRLPVKLSQVKKALKSFKLQRADLDCVELILLWLAYVWGVGRSENPLLDGYGTPSAAFIEALVSACQFDLTPGLQSRASCPEAIWQAARYWYEFHESSIGGAAIRGMWHTEHYLGT